MGHTHLARSRIRRPTKQADVADRVVRRAEGTARDERVLLIKQTTDAVDFRRLDRLVESHRRHDGGNALGEHAFARTRRPDEQEVVGSSDGDLDGAFHLVLAFDLRKIHLGGRGGVEDLGGIGAGGGEVDFAGEEFVGFAKIFHPVDLDALHDRGLGGIRGGENDGFLATRAGLDGDRQSAFDGADFSGEGEFADDKATLEARKFGAFGGSNHPHSNREIETRTLFFNIGRGEVDGRALAGPTQAAVRDGGGDAVLALADGGVGQADDNHDGVARAGVHLDLHFNGFNALNGGGENAGKHGQALAETRCVVASRECSPMRGEP